MFSGSLELLVEFFLLCLGMEYLIRKFTKFVIRRISWVRRLMNITDDSEGLMSKDKMCRRKRQTIHNNNSRQRKANLRERFTCPRRANLTLNEGRRMRVTDPLRQRIITQGSEMSGLTPRERERASVLSGQSPRVGAGPRAGAQAARHIRINPDGSRARRIDKVSTESYFCGCRSCLTIGPEKCKTIRCILCGPSFFRNH